MTYYRDIYLKSAHWRNFRADTLARITHCQDCGLSRNLCRLFYLSDLDLHHLNYKRLGKELPSDVRVLCRACHEIAEIPKHWPEHMPFLGFPEFEATCPQCDRTIFLSIPFGDTRFPKGEFDYPQYVAGEPYACGCECCEEDFYGFIEENIEQLIAERRAAA